MQKRRVSQDQYSTNLSASQSATRKASCSTAGDEKSHPRKLKIFVGGIPPDTNKAELSNYFSQFGRVTKVDLPVNRKSGGYKGFAFVTFATPAAATGAVEASSHSIRDKNMVVKEALSASMASKKTKQL